MKKIMKKELLVALTMVFVLLLYGFSPFMIAQESNLNVQDKQKQCGAAKEGLQLCSEASTVSAEINEPIILTLLLKNVSDDNIQIFNFGGIVNMYSISVKAPSGDKVYSKREVLRKNATTEEEKINLIPFGSSRFGGKVLKPNDVFSLTFDLAKLYKFQMEGDYKVTISRILGEKLLKRPSKKPKPSKRLRLGTIIVHIN